jgi:hypothetical protein
MALWLTMLLAGTSRVCAQVSVHLDNPVVRIARGSSVDVTVRLSNLEDRTVYLSGFGSDLPEALLASDGFAAYASTRPDSLLIAEAWEGVLVNITVAPDAPVGAATHAITLLGGLESQSNEVVAQALLRVETFDATCAPLILTQPEPATVDSGGSVTLLATAGQVVDAEYQWRKDGWPVFDDGRISGAQTASLAVTIARGTDAGAYELVIWNDCGEVTTVPVTLNVTGVLAVPGPPAPRVLAFALPRPNPARGWVTLAWALPKAGHVSLDVLDLAGRTVRRLVDGVEETGEGHVRWDGTLASGSRVAPGVYFARLRTAGAVRVRRIVLL